MSLRLLAALMVALLCGWVLLRPVLDDGQGTEPDRGAQAATMSAVGKLLPLVALADNEDNNGGGDNGGADNGNADNGGGDNSDSDNSDSGNSNSNDNSNSNSNGNDNSNSSSNGNGNGNDNSGVEVVQRGGTATPTDATGSGGEGSQNGVAAPVPTPIPTLVISLTDPRGIPQSSVLDTGVDDGITEAAVTSSGTVAEAAIRGKRVVVRIFPSLPSGITVTLRQVDWASLPALPGAKVGDLAFTVDAVDAAGRSLAVLPAGVNLNVQYQDVDVAGLDEARVELAHLGPGEHQWRPAPNLVRDAETRFVAATITELGAYGVRVP